MHNIPGVYLVYRSSFLVVYQETMTGTGEQGELGSPSLGLGSGRATPRDEILDDSHQEILRRKAMVESEGRAVIQEFEALLKEKTKVKSRLTSTKTATENDLKNEAHSTNKSYLHITFIKSMLDVKQEILGKKKALLDRIFGEIIAIIDAYDSGTVNGRQWEEAQNFKESFTREWAEETQRLRQFGEYMTKMSDKITGSQEMDWRGGRDRMYIPQERWRGRTDLDPGMITEETIKF